MVSVNVSPHTYSHTPCYLYFNSFFYYISLKVQGIIRVVNFMWTLSVSLFFKNTPFPGLSSSLRQVEVIFNVFFIFSLNGCCHPCFRPHLFTHLFNLLPSLLLLCLVAIFSSYLQSNTLLLVF